MTLIGALCGPTTPRMGSVGGFVGEFCWRTPRGGRGLVSNLLLAVSTFRESACKCALRTYHVVILNGCRERDTY